LRKPLALLMEEEIQERMLFGAAVEADVVIPADRLELAA
jgi:hypothetical protein